MNALLNLTLLGLLIACAESMHRHRQEQQQADMYDLNAMEEDPLLDAHHLSVVLQLCKEEPERCTNEALAEIFANIEGGDETKTIDKRLLVDTNYITDSSERLRRSSRRRRKRSTSMFFLLAKSIKRRVRTQSENKFIPHDAEE